MSGPSDPTSGSAGTSAIATEDVRPEPDRPFLSNVLGHKAADSFSQRGGSTTRLVTPMVGGAVDDGSYLRALFGNLYFAVPVLGFVLGLVAGISTSGLAVPPSLDLTLLLIALGAFDALAGLLALAGFTLVTLFTGNLVGSHMFSAPPGEQTAVYTLTGLFGLGVLWFAGGTVAKRLRPYRPTPGNSATVWAQRAVDLALVPIVGTFAIWLVAWQMPLLTGNGPQELFVTIQNHLNAIKVVAFSALLARTVAVALTAHHLRRRSKEVARTGTRERPLVFSVLFWAVCGAFGAMVLWETLGFGTTMWVSLILLLAIAPAAWAGRRLSRWTITYLAFPIVLLRMIIVVLCAQFVLSRATQSQVNPQPMLGAVLVTVGALLVLFAFLDHPMGVGRRRDWKTAAADAVALTLLVLVVYGVLAFTSTPFNAPRGVYVAPTGSVFVADTGNNRVVLILKSGYRETVGTGLLHPSDVVADPAADGYVFIADAGNDRIVRLSGLDQYSIGDPSFSYALAQGAVGEVSLGSGLNDPQALSLDANGDVFIADTGNNRIVELHAGSWAQTTVLTGHGLSHPLGVLSDPFDASDVYVANTGAGTVLEIHPHGKVTTLLTGLDEPAGLAEDPAGTLYVSEMGNGKVLAIPDQGTGTPTVVAHGLGGPRGLSVDALGNLFVTNTDNGQVAVVGTLREHKIMTHGTPDPTAVAVGDPGAIWVVNGKQGSLQRFLHGSLTTTATGLYGAVGVAPSSNGAVWVDMSNGELALVKPNGTWRVVVHGLNKPGQLYSLPVGRGGAIVTEEGTGKSGGKVLAVDPDGTTKVLLHGLDAPVAVAADAYGQIVVGLQNGDVYEYSAKGTRTFLFNVGGITAIAMDGRGNAYVASSAYRLIIEHMAATGRAAVVNRDFRSITGMSVTSRGVLWIADQKSLGLWKVVPTRARTQL